MDAFQHRLLVLLIRGENRPPGHGGDAAGPDQAGHSGNLHLGEAAPLPDRHIVSGLSASDAQTGNVRVTPQLHSVAGQLFQHPSQQLSVKGQGVILLDGAGQLLLQRDLQVGGGEYQRLAGGRRLQAYPLQNLQG